MSEERMAMPWQAWQVDETGEKERLLAEADSREDLDAKLGRKPLYFLYRILHLDRPTEGWRVARR
jgi:hypothetical protein